LRKDQIAQLLVRLAPYAPPLALSNLTDLLISSYCNDPLKERTVAWVGLALFVVTHSPAGKDRHRLGLFLDGSHAFLTAEKSQDYWRQDFEKTRKE
jgi:hypothetical protein